MVRIAAVVVDGEVVQNVQLQDVQEVGGLRLLHAVQPELEVQLE
jgi:hypothetical protein